MPAQTEPKSDMEIHDEFVPEEQYSAFVATMPQVCVEIVFQTDRGILLARRENHPRDWFWPGGRLFKGEQLAEAAHRIAGEELDIEIDIVEKLGSYSHFWDGDSEQGLPSRHTVNIPFLVTPTTDDFEIALDSQHSEYRFVDEIEPDMHEYVSRYLRDNELL